MRPNRAAATPIGQKTQPKQKNVGFSRETIPKVLNLVFSRQYRNFYSICIGVWVIDTFRGLIFLTVPKVESGLEFSRGHQASLESRSRLLVLFPALSIFEPVILDKLSYSLCQDFKLEWKICPCNPDRTQKSKNIARGS